MKIPLVVKSYYSLMWGTASPEDICTAAKALGYRKVALADTDNLYGLWPFLHSCRRLGIEPVVGAELSDPCHPYRVVCLVENQEGYQNLCRLITRRHTDGCFDLKSDIASYAKGLVLLTQSPEPLLFLHEMGATVAAVVFCRPGSGALHLRKVAAHVGVPMLAIPASVFLRPDDHAVHSMLRAIELNISLSDLTGGDMVSPNAWLASPAEYARRFCLWPEALAEAGGFFARLAFTGPDNRLVMPPWNNADDISAKDTLRREAFRGARIRYGEELSEPIVDRLEHELGIIEQKGFASYFLVVKHIVSRSPRTCGRGSGAASLVAYCLGITNVCPVKYNLYFERFLNPGRKDPPDIDVDFAWDERDYVLDSVLKQYAGYAAMVCNHVVFQPRMAIREVAKVYGLTDREIGQVSKKLSWFWRADLEQTDMLPYLKQLPELGTTDFQEPWPEIINMAQRIIGVPRYLSVHPGGVVISPEPLDASVPIQIAPKGFPVIQWEKDGTEDGGLVKIDLLGNRSLGVIRDVLANLHENGVDFDERKWEPEEDASTQANVAKGFTMGCFYIESPAMRLLQKKTKKGDFEHLVIHSSIIRPAANEFIREYVRRLHGGVWEPIHPLLSDVLEETFGIMVYQEDVSRVAVALAGFSHEDADGLRKIMSKKDRARRLEDYHKQFFEGARKRNVSEGQIRAIWEMMMSFSGYSFCKPHSASYARVSFQAAFLKTHYPAEFMAAVISNQGGFYSTFAYVSEARRIGVQVLPPDVNTCDIAWKGKGNAMRVGLLSVKHLGTRTRTKIIEVRQKKKFRNIRDFLERVRPDEQEARALIFAGGFDSLHPQESRASLLWELSGWHRKKTEITSAPDLFGIEKKVERPMLPQDNPLERLRQEFGVLGFLCSNHPMELYQKALRGQAIVKAKDLGRFTGRRIRFAGLLITGKVVHTKKGEPMEFLTFEDETGTVETTFFPAAYKRFCAMLDQNRPFLLYGKVEEDFGVQTLTVDRVAPVTKLNDTFS